MPLLWNPCQVTQKLPKAASEPQAQGWGRDWSKTSEPLSKMRSRQGVGIGHQHGSPAWLDRTLAGAALLVPRSKRTV